MSHGHDDHSTHKKVEAALGAAAELAKQGGLMQTAARQQLYHSATHHGVGQFGAMVASTALAAAPVVAAGAMAVASVVIPVAAVGGVAYAAVKLVKWVCEQ